MSLQARARARAHVLVTGLVLGAAIVHAAPASAQDRRTETAAKDALKRVQADFRSSAFDEAIKRLQKAINACGTVRCATTTRAALHRDLGVMQFRKGNRAAAASSFVEALRLDPRIEPNPTFDAPDVRLEWDGAKEEASVARAEQPIGDFSHSPVPEQTVRTPVPVYVEYIGNQSVSSVIVKYRGTPSGEYKRLNLSKMGNGWGAVIPCGDVKRGVMRYYVQGFDAGGEPIALSGDPKKPYFVRIRTALTGSPPSLPGRAPPTTCTDTTNECPPDMPNCQNTAEAPEQEEQPSGEEQAEAAPEMPPGTFARFWVGVSGSFDIVSLPGANDVCRLDGQGLPTSSAGYYCTNPYGSDFPSRSGPAENQTIAPDKGGNVAGGLGFGNIRVMASLDYALSANLLVGGRLGYVIHTYPGQAASRDGRLFSTPIHLEARGTYLIGDKPLAHTGFAPLVLVAAGMSEMEASTTTQVTQTTIAGDRPMQVWLPAGPWFLSLGGGARYALSQHAAVLSALKLTGAFGGNGFVPVFSPEIAFQYGF